MLRFRPVPLAAAALAFLMAATATPAAPGSGQDVSSLRTAAERTGFAETTRYGEVVDLMRAFDRASDRLHMTTFGYTYEGRALPLMVVGDVAGADADTVRASGKTRVWIQGNIHSGEACGKEAMLMLLRDLASGGHAEWDEELVLLVAPIYNADGNERVKVDNRGGQHGPIAGMGQRPNAQGYDLNRDHMKLDSPEARSLVGMMNAYDPHVAVDLHTTNGTRHAYHLTYSPPLHPNTPAAIDDLLRQEWLPAVTRSIKDKYGWDFYYYGNAAGGGGRRGRGGAGARAGVPAGTGPRGGAAGARGDGAVAAGGGPDGAQRQPVWRTFDHRPRFNNNYVGLRNRFAILSEAYAYATFEDRIMATLRFVEEIVDFATANASRIVEITNAADSRAVTGERLAVRATFRQSEVPVEILMGETEPELNPYSGRMMNRRLDAVRPVMMYEAGTFEATQEETAPLAYFVPAEEREALIKLQLHGIVAEPLVETLAVAGERFMIGSSEAAERPFQGHNERTLEGAWEAAQLEVPAGTMVVRLDQPLGRLAFSLLEPRADDGLVNWNVFDRSLEGASVYPVQRTSTEYRR